MKKRRYRVVEEYIRGKSDFWLERDHGGWWWRVLSEPQASLEDAIKRRDEIEEIIKDSERRRIQRVHEI